MRYFTSVTVWVLAILLGVPKAHTNNFFGRFERGLKAQVIRNDNRPAVVIACDILNYIYRRTEYFIRFDTIQ